MVSSASFAEKKDNSLLVLRYDGNVDLAVRIFVINLEVIDVKKLFKRLDSSMSVVVLLFTFKIICLDEYFVIFDDHKTSYTILCLFRVFFIIE